MTSGQEKNLCQRLRQQKKKRKTMYRKPPVLLFHRRLTSMHSSWCPPALWRSQAQWREEGALGSAEVSSRITRCKLSELPCWFHCSVVHLLEKNKTTHAPLTVHCMGEEL